MLAIEWVHSMALHSVAQMQPWMVGQSAVMLKHETTCLRAIH